MTSPMPSPETETQRPMDAAHAADLLVHVARLAHGQATDPSLTAAQWTALRYFASANRFSRTPSAFSQFHVTTRGTASQTVKSLVSLGLLQRTPCEHDGRVARIDVTEAGHLKLASDPLRDLSRCIDALPAAQRSAFTEALATISSALAGLRAAPQFGNCNDCGHCDTSQPASTYCRCTQSILGGADLGALCVDFVPLSDRRKG
ncbi:MarR family winged helix-turn-helix transcriptional regulator [Pararhodobacter oceanensis]|nr:helix-turn-helix domain-containing protein [Pararhodobacter oceanensis]